MKAAGSAAPEAEPGEALLAPDEPPPFAAENLSGRGSFVLLCEHAGQRIPRRLGDLGVSEADLQRHIAWDIGALGVARVLSRRFDAPLLFQRYSRLVCDCNRLTSVASFIPAVSEDVPIPCNAKLGEEERRRRAEEIFWPFHNGVKAVINARRGRPTIVISIHSFTPVFLGRTRPWQIGILYAGYRDLPLAVLAALRREPDLVVGENEPYFMDRDSDYTLFAHAEDRGLPCLEVEWRQDLVADEEGQRRWANRVAGAIEAACRDLGLPV
jgi:predicted N-formylglutamate amidohydrolase